MDNVNKCPHCDNDLDFWFTNFLENSIECNVLCESCKFSGTFIFVPKDTVKYCSECASEENEHLSLQITIEDDGTLINLAECDRCGNSWEDIYTFSQIKK